MCFDRGVYIESIELCVYVCVCLFPSLKVQNFLYSSDMLGFLKLLKIFLFLLEMDSSYDYKYCNNLNVTAYVGKLSCDFKKSHILNIQLVMIMGILGFDFINF